VVADGSYASDPLSKAQPCTSKRWKEAFEHGYDDIRETYLRTYRIVYRVDERCVCVLTVFDRFSLRLVHEEGLEPAGKLNPVACTETP
jgi:hypothetical protein